MDWVLNLKLEDQNSVEAVAIEISSAYSRASFSGRLTRMLTGYLFIEASNGFKQRLTAEWVVDACIKPEFVIIRFKIADIRR